MDEGAVLAHQHLDVVGVEDLTALRTLEVDPALLDLDPDVLLQTHHAGQVVAVAQIGELIAAGLRQAQRALSDDGGHGGGVGAVRGAARGALHAGGGAVGVPLPRARHPAGLALRVRTGRGRTRALPGLAVASFPQLPPVLSSGERRRQQRVGVEQSPQRESRSGF